jgi:hypothetical protein
VLRNRTFSSILVEGIRDAPGDKNSRPPLPHAIMSLSSYLLTHATSTSSFRAIGYANVALHILLASVESENIIRAFCEPSPQPVRLCRQVCLIVFCDHLFWLKKVERDSQCSPFHRLLGHSSALFWIVAYSGSDTTCTNDLKGLYTCKHLCRESI